MEVIRRLWFAAPSSILAALRSLSRPFLSLIGLIFPAQYPRWHSIGQVDRGDQTSNRDIICEGANGRIERCKKNVVVKCPRPASMMEGVDAVKIEQKLFEILGHHPRLVRYLGLCEDPVGLLFEEANCGDLQDYIWAHNASIDMDTRLKWRIQAAEAISYIHSKGVIHSDLRTDNFLLHCSDGSSSPDLLLCDFGGSLCETENIDGLRLPDSAFYNPLSNSVTTVDTDIFSLGTLFYAITTGQWPYDPSLPFPTMDARLEYDDKIMDLYSRKEFPSVEGLIGGDIIRACWLQEIKDAETLVGLHKSLIEQHSKGA